MSDLTEEQLANLTRRLAERKSLLMDEIRQVLARSSNERYADLVGGPGDAGDESVAALIRSIAEAEVVRDIGEVRDIVAAEERVAARTYGVCIDCGEPVDYLRLDAYPSAKRCFACQRHREKTRAPSKYTGH